MRSIVVILFKLKFEMFKYVNNLQLANINDISLTCEVLKLVKSKLIKFPLEENINFILTTLFVIKLLKSNVVNDVHSLNILRKSQPQ